MQQNNVNSACSFPSRGSQSICPVSAARAALGGERLNFANTSRTSELPNMLPRGRPRESSQYKSLIEVVWPENCTMGKFKIGWKKNIPVENNLVLLVVLDKEDEMRIMFEKAYVLFCWLLLSSFSAVWSGLRPRRQVGRRNHLKQRQNLIWQQFAHPSNSLWGLLELQRRQDGLTEAFWQVRLLVNEDLRRDDGAKGLESLDKINVRELLQGRQ